MRILQKLYLQVSFFNVHADNDIDSAALQHLTATLIKELIPKIGLRIKFMKKWEEHFKRSQDASRNGDVENVQVCSCY